MAGRVLAVAESDTSGAGGIQADIKTILALGGYAMASVSVITAQTHGHITEIQALSPSLVAAQMRASLDEVGADAIKIGFLQNAEMINAVADVLDEYQDKKIPVVVDPSIVSRKGDVLVDAESIAAWKRRLYIRASVLTPNLKEAEVLAGMNIRDLETMRHASEMMRTLGVENVVLKARQTFTQHELYSVATNDGERLYERSTHQTVNTLGAGSTFSSAIATGLAQNMNIFMAVERALGFLDRAMQSTFAANHPEGALNHAFDTERYANQYELAIDG